jgi:hypothetical protein
MRLPWGSGLFPPRYTHQQEKALQGDIQSPIARDSRCLTKGADDA